RCGGQPTAASRPAPDRIEVPIGGDGGPTRGENLLAGDLSPPPGRERLSPRAPLPDEPLQRPRLKLLLPPSLPVEEGGRRSAHWTEPASPSSPPVFDETRGDRAALELVERLAAADAHAGREGAWSPRTEFPAAPLAFATDLVDVGQNALPLTLTLLA